ncbi:MAG: ABC transporter ATP-binding protein [Parvibaculaceae bacterium]
MPIAGGHARLEVSIAEKRYLGADGQPVEVLRDLRFAVEPGEVVALLGRSGCGKTTALRIVLGLDRDFRGAVEARADRVAAVFQEPRLLPWRTVEQNVRLALPDGEMEKPLEGLFSSLGLADKRASYPGELSMGLARRAALARAFALEPDLLVMDEPFVSLDAQTALDMRRLLARLLEERPTTVLMVTHNAEEAIELADRLLFLSPRPAHVVGEIPVARARSERCGEFRRRLREEIGERFPSVLARA